MAAKQKKSQMPDLPHFHDLEMSERYNDNDGSLWLTSVNEGPIKVVVKVQADEATAQADEATAWRHGKLISKAKDLAAFADDALFQILTFDARCKEEEYTDTDEVWKLLNHIKDKAKKLLNEVSK